MVIGNLDRNSTKGLRVPFAVSPEFPEFGAPTERVICDDEQETKAKVEIENQKVLRGIEDVDGVYAAAMADDAAYLATGEYQGKIDAIEKNKKEKKVTKSRIESVSVLVW